MIPRPRAAALLAVALSAMLLTTTGCGEPQVSGTRGDKIQTLPATTLPKSLNALSVRPENVKKALKKAKHSYVDAVGFYSLRKGKVVEATIQVSRFGPEARLDSEDFRKTLIQQASPSTATPVNVGGASIQQSLGTKSTVSIWFSKGRMVVLTVLLTYQGGRGLLEQTLVALPVT